MPAEKVSEKVVYTYICYDTLTNLPIQELPFSRSGIELVLNQGSTSNFSIPAYTGVYDKFLELITEPARTIIYVDRNGVLLNGFMVTAATYQSQAKIWEISASTLDSYPERRTFDESFLRANKDPRNIFCELWQTMQNTQNGDVGVQLPDEYPFTTLNKMNVVVAKTDNRTFKSVMDECVGSDPGFDWTINYYYDTSKGYRVPAKKLRMGSPKLTNDNSVVFAYPGNITNYYKTKTMSNGGTHIVGVGAGEGSTSIRKVAKDDLILSSGTPRVDYVVTFKNEASSDKLLNRTVAELQARRLPIVKYTVQIDPNQSPKFGEYGLGDTVILSITETDKYGKIVHQVKKQVTIIGLSITPPSSENSESIQVVLYGEDDGASISTE